MFWINQHFKTNRLNESFKDSVLRTVYFFLNKWVFFNESFERKMQWFAHKETTCLVAKWISVLNKSIQWFGDSPIKAVISRHPLVNQCNLQKDSLKTPTTDSQTEQTQVEWYKQWYHHSWIDACPMRFEDWSVIILCLH